MILLADVLMVPVFMINLCAGLPASILPIIIEWVVLRRLGWETKRALRDAFSINLASTIIGVFVVQMLPVSITGCDFTECLTTPSFWGYLLILWVCTVIIEGITLTLLYRHPPQQRQLWKASMIVNIVSYVLLAPLFLLFIGNSLR